MGVGMTLVFYEWKLIVNKVVTLIIVNINTQGS